MRRWRSVVAVVAGLLLTVSAPAGAVDSPPRPPPSALGLIGDLRLTVLARRALQGDPALGRLNLGVRVRDGVATVWGPVPSDAVIRASCGQAECRALVIINSHRTAVRPSIGWTATTSAGRCRRMVGSSA